jgi:hypothetical protein
MTGKPQLRFALFIMSIKTPVRAFLVLLLASTSAHRLRAAEPAEKPAGVHVPAASRTIWLEPKGGTFHPVIISGTAEGSYSCPLGVIPPEGEVLAVYATDGRAVQGDPPIARYLISGRKSGATSRVDVTLTLHRGALETTVKDAHGTPLTVAWMNRNEIARAALPPAKIAASKPAANQPAPIGEIDGKSLSAPVGLRSGNGVFVPFFPAKAAPGAKTTLVKARRFPGQTTADIVVYQGESPYVEKNREVAHYLVSGLSDNPKAKFEFEFTVETSGKVKLAQALDTATKQPLEIHPYSDALARRLKESFDDNGAPAPVAARGR